MLSQQQPDSPLDALSWVEAADETVNRVRAGPYRSQDEAQAARARLLAAGYAPTLVK